MRKNSDPIVELFSVKTKKVPMNQIKLFAEWHNLYNALAFTVNENSRGISNGSIPGLKNPRFFYV